MQISCANYFRLAAKFAQHEGLRNNGVIIVYLYIYELGLFVCRLVFCTGALFHHAVTESEAHKENN